MRDDTALAGRRLIATLGVALVAGCGAERNLGPDETAAIVRKRLERPTPVACRQGPNEVDYMCETQPPGRDSAVAIVEVDENGVTSLRWIP